MTALAAKAGVFCLLLATVTVRAATVQVCPIDANADEERGSTYDANGRLVHVVVSDAPAADPRCQTVTLPVPAQRIRWSALSELRPQSGPAMLSLQGYFRADGAEISEILGAPSARPDPDFLPLSSNVLPAMQAAAFGAEGRSSVDAEMHLQCQAGRRPAGFYLQSALRWESLPRMQIELTLRGRGEFEVAIADDARQEAPLPLGRVQLQDEARRVRFELPVSSQPWTRLTVSCPAIAADVQVQAIQLLPPVPEASMQHRAAWLWAPQWWQQRREQLWQLVTREQLQQLFLTVPIDAAGKVEQASQLTEFLREARARQLQVWAVIGDRHDVLPNNLPLLQKRVGAYLDYNATHDERIAGVQLDIEPYLLPGYALAPAYWRERYLATVTAVQAQTREQMPLDLVVPWWWGTHPDWGSHLLTPLQQKRLTLTVMNYRTNAEALRAGALPFLAWGRQSGNKVRMALEQGMVGVNAGNGSNETLRRYAADATAGELWLLEVGGNGLLILLDDAASGLPGRAYRRMGESVVDVRNLTFAGREQALRTLANELATEWSAWDSFAGLAIHGIDQAQEQGR